MSNFHRITLLGSCVTLWLYYWSGRADNLLLPVLATTAFALASVLDSFDYERKRGV